MIARITPNHSSGRKLAVVVSAKFFKKAVTRNLLKRRVRAAIRPFLKNLQLPIMVRLSAGADQTTFADLSEDFKKQLKNYLK